MVATFSVAMFAASVTMADPKSAPAATDMRGCCLCRGIEGGTQSTLRSCSDGASVSSCESTCRDLNADSLVFGNGQTCSGGCGGFPTQSLH